MEQEVKKVEEKVRVRNLASGGRIEKGGDLTAQIQPTSILCREAKSKHKSFVPLLWTAAGTAAAAAVTAAAAWKPAWAAAMAAWLMAFTFNKLFGREQIGLYYLAGANRKHNRSNGVRNSSYIRRTYVPHSLKNPILHKVIFSTFSFSLKQ